MREYQRNRRKALQGSVKPDVKCKANDVNLCKAVKPECDNCKAEYKRGFQEGYDKAKSEIVDPGASCDTVYVPDPVKPVKAPKISASKQALPIVKSMLSGIKRAPIVSHHPQCSCAMCKPVTPVASKDDQGKRKCV